MKKNLLMAFVGLAGSLLYVSSAQATSVPALSLSLQEDSMAAVTGGSSTGVVSMNNVTYGDFLLNTVSGIGTPVLGSPYLDLQTLNISTPTMTGGHTLTIKLTETGLTATTSSLPLTSAFTGILNGVSSETVTSYYDASNTAFGTANVLDTATFGGLSNNVTMSANENISNLSNPFSETEIIVANFSAGMDTLNSSALIEAGTSTPEPASCALIGGGLLGVALIRRRRRSTN